MIWSIFLISLSTGSLTDEFFEKMISCESSPPFLSVKIESLLQCAMKCISADNHLSFTYLENTMVCNLYTAQESCCPEAMKVGIVSYRRKVYDCVFDTAASGGHVSISDRCGSMFLKQSLSFRVKGTGIARVSMLGRHGHQYRLRMFDTTLNFVDLSYVNKPAYVEMQGTVYHPETWMYYWVAFSNFENATTTVEVGMDQFTGCNVILKRYDGISFILEDVYVDHFQGVPNTAWNFYGGN